MDETIWDEPDDEPYGLTDHNYCMYKHMALWLQFLSSEHLRYENKCYVRYDACSCLATPGLTLNVTLVSMERLLQGLWGSLKQDIWSGLPSSGQVFFYKLRPVFPDCPESWSQTTSAIDVFFFFNFLFLQYCGCFWSKELSQRCAPCLWKYETGRTKCSKIINKDKCHITILL